MTKAEWQEIVVRAVEQSAKGDTDMLNALTLVLSESDKTRVALRELVTLLPALMEALDIEPDEDIGVPYTGPH
jgi:hypothetical protein